MNKSFILLFVVLCLCQAKYNPWTSNPQRPHYTLTTTGVIATHKEQHIPVQGPSEVYNPYWPNSRRFHQQVISKKIERALKKIKRNMRKSFMRLHKKSTPLGGLHQYHPNYSYTANSHPQPNYKPNYPRQHYDFALDSKLNPGGPLFQYDAWGNGFATKRH